MMLIIDNYDSFTYNLVHYFQILGQKVSVYYHDAITLAEISELSPDSIVLSPGPKRPEDTGISLELIKEFYQQFPILGICLGHQCLAHVFGAAIIQAKKIMHGKTSTLFHYNEGLFKDLPQNFQVTRYHSLVIDPATLPSSFTIDAYTEDAIMAIRHREYPLFGLQFHPEAILSEQGLPLLERFINVSSQRNFRTVNRTKVPYASANALRYDCVDEW